MSTSGMSVQHILAIEVVDMALATTAQMFGLSKATVVKIVQIGLPLIAQMAGTNPEVMRRLFANSQARMPVPIQDFYVRMAEKSSLRQSIMDDYKATFGLMFDTVNREAARQAGTTDGQARDVLAAMLPVVSLTWARANASRSKEEFAQRLQDLHAQGDR
jgi:hypothetical protein